MLVANCAFYFVYFHRYFSIILRASFAIFPYQIPSVNVIVEEMPHLQYKNFVSSLPNFCKIQAAFYPQVFIYPTTYLYNVTAPQRTRPPPAQVHFKTLATLNIKIIFILCSLNKTDC